MVLLSEYKDIFGAPNTGVHSYRLFDVAIIDLALTIAVAYLITYMTHRKNKVDIDLEASNVKKIKCDAMVSFTFSFLKNTFYLLLVGIFMHGLFGVNTKLNTILFGKL